MRTRTRVHYSASAAPGGYPAELSVSDGMSEVAGTLLQPELTGHSALGSGSHRSGPCTDEIATMLSPLDGAADAGLSARSSTRHRARTAGVVAQCRRSPCAHNSFTSFAPPRCATTSIAARRRKGAKLPRRDRLEAWSQSAAVVGVFSKARRPAQDMLSCGRLHRESVASHSRGGVTSRGDTRTLSCTRG